MKIRLLFERDLPPEGVVEFKRRATTNTQKLSIKRLFVQQPLLTYPRALSSAEIDRMLETLSIYQYLKALHHRPVRNAFSHTTHTRTHALYLEKAPQLRSIESQFVHDGIKILVPPQRELDCYRVQRFAYEYLLQFLRIEAETILVPLVKRYAYELNLQYRTIKITTPSLKWGSCSSDGVLTFSIFAMLLPDALLRYLLLHELAHLTYLNHSPRFWELLNIYLDNEAEELDSKLKKFMTSAPIPELF